MSQLGQPIAASLQPSVADVLLDALELHGVEYLFANPGSDFPSIIEGLARKAQGMNRAPKPILTLHESTAVAMAHGYTMVTHRPQAVMVHVSVGTGNLVMGIINANRDRVPMLIMAGRTPVSEIGPKGTRDRHINWGQELFDQAALVRELVKWDYELRLPQQTRDVVARAFELANASPKGPVYLTLPREVLAETADDSSVRRRRAQPPRTPYPDPSAIAELARLVTDAEFPLIITANAGRTIDEAKVIERVTEKFALPVISFNPRFLPLPSHHSMNLGYEPNPLLGQADLLIVLDCDVPWIPSVESPAASAPIVHVGEDPGFFRYPMRSFPVDLSITSSVAAALAMLETELEKTGGLNSARVERRRSDLKARVTALRAQRSAKLSEAAAAITPEYLSHCISTAIGPSAIVVNEQPLRLDYFVREEPGTFFSLSSAGGLGWGLGAALGAKLASPDRLVVAAIGDGAYVFANPASCHWTSRAHDLPILAIIFNNSLYGSVRNGTMRLYPHGAASVGNKTLLANLKPELDYEKFVEAAGGVGMRVERPGELPDALRRAVDIVAKEKRQVLMNVICPY